MTDKPKVLLVEDNPINQKVASFHCRNFGFEVDIAENGKIGVEKFIENKYFFILMDIRMPILDGYGAVRLIREYETHNQPGHHIPIIALTANAFDSDRQECMESGMDEYVAKPYTAEDLKTALRRLHLLSE
jgi:CheY-like chemotaxis protein